MDLTDITQALDDLYRLNRQLPQPDGLAQIVLDAWTSNPSTTPQNPAGRTEAVIRAIWPIGATLGAQRGHDVAASAIRDMLGEGLAADIPNPDGVELFWACSRIADEFPATADPAEVAARVQNVQQWMGNGDRVNAALAVGFHDAWVAGHRDATHRLVQGFELQITALVGVDELMSTFLNVELTGQDLVADVCAAAYRASERDLVSPALPEGRVLDRGRNSGRAFPGLHQIHPTTGKPSQLEPRRAGSDRRGPGR